jgi:hypothetical protein
MAVDIMADDNSRGEVARSSRERRQEVGGGLITTVNVADGDGRRDGRLKPDGHIHGESLDSLRLKSTVGATPFIPPLPIWAIPQTRIKVRKVQP